MSSTLSRNSIVEHPMFWPTVALSVFIVVTALASAYGPAHPIPGDAPAEPIGGRPIPPDDEPWGKGDPNPNPEAPGKWKPPQQFPGKDGPGPYGPH